MKQLAMRRIENAEEMIAIPCGDESHFQGYLDKLAEELLEQIGPVAKDLGVVQGAEIVATQRISQKVERYYVAVYYTRRPLWLSLERYVLPDKTTSLGLRFSTDEDKILPSYLTDVQQ